MDSKTYNVPEGSNFHLFSYYRSSCSARLRIALALKGIIPQTTFVNLIAGEHQNPSYGLVNPSMSVPTLQITTGSQTIKITQSIAALEYLEEAFPQKYPLLPPISDPERRAIVRTLVGIVACDIQPPTNLRVLVRARTMASAAGQDPAAAAQQWAKEFMTNGLLAYEAVCADVAGRYSVGDSITMADCCLVPAIWGAERFGVDLTQMPTVMGVYLEMSKTDAVIRSHWKAQKDTPEELRK